MQQLEVISGSTNGMVATLMAATVLIKSVRALPKAPVRVEQIRLQRPHPFHRRPADEWPRKTHTDDRHATKSGTSNDFQDVLRS